MNIQVNPAHQFDISGLEEWCRTTIPEFGAVREIIQISGRVSNPTFFLSTEHSSRQHEFVLRKQPPGKLLPSAHQVDREHRIMTALASSDVPVPRTYALCTAQASSERHST